MTKYVSTYNLKPGNVIAGQDRKPLIFLFEGRGRKYTLWGAYTGDAERMIAKEKGFRSRFYGIAPRDTRIEVIRTVSPSVVKKLNELYKEMVQSNTKRRDENFKRLDFTHEEKYNGYVLKLDNGEEVKPGDTVVVSFKNGTTVCRVGNKNGVLYDTKSGDVYVWPYQYGVPDPYRKHAIGVHPKYILRKVEKTA